MKTKHEGNSAEALSKAVNGTSTMNYGTIFEGFAERGIPSSDIEPRVNVLTFKAWLAKGRAVRKGERGVGVTTFIPSTRTDPGTGETRSGSRPWRTTVFHISQTEKLQ